LEDLDRFIDDLPEWYDRLGEEFGRKEAAHGH
jgi:hypothetical protein